MAAYTRKNPQHRQLVFLAAGCLLLQLLHTHCSVLGFTTTTTTTTTTTSFQNLHKRFPRTGIQTSQHLSSPTTLKMGISPATSRIDISVPSQAKCEELGVREWPQQSKQGIWTESVSPENSLTRYVLEGTGSLEIRQGDDGSQILSVNPGTLVEIQAGTPEVQLEWTSKTDEMILLTPGFEEGGVFLGVLAGIFVMFGILLSGVLG